MLNVRNKTEQLFHQVFFEIDQKKSGEIACFQAPKNGLVGDVARLPFYQFFDSGRTNLIQSHKHHVECAE
jgi:hypothetical protein